MATLIVVGGFPTRCHIEWCWGSSGDCGDVMEMNNRSEIISHIESIEKIGKYILCVLKKREVFDFRRREKFPRFTVSRFGSAVFWLGLTNDEASKVRVIQLRTPPGTACDEIWGVDRGARPIPVGLVSMWLGYLCTCSADVSYIRFDKVQKTKSPNIICRVKRVSS